MATLLHVFVAATLVGMALSPELVVARCRPCGFGGLCETESGLEPCAPSVAGCTPRSGILVFNSTTPTYTYWTLFAKKRLGSRHGRFGGKLKVHVDEGDATATVPGFPPRRCVAETCFGDNARFLGAIADDRLSAKAFYPNGEVCVFHISLKFGLGETEPNHFECRNADSAMLSAGPLDLQGIRLFGCRE